MKTIKMPGRWLVLCGLALATTALAQKEQWLEYHTSREGRSYRYMQLSTNRPANVALPKFNAQPYFARWTTPMDPSGGRWLCFDRSRKSGPYDRLYIDSTGNGRLDDKPALNAARTDQYNAYFDPARIVFRGEDGPITYHLVLRFSKYGDSSTYALMSSGGYYAGQVDLGGTKRGIELIDNNANGTFNDQSTDAAGCDCVRVEKDKDGQRYLGKLLETGGQFFRIEVARDGAFVKLQKADHLSFGQVRVPETISQFVALGDNGHFTRKPVKGEFSLPAGKYHILEWSIDRKDSKGASWKLMGYGFNDSASFEVAAGKPARVEVGEPVRATMEARESSGRVNFSLRFQGRYGESVQIQKGTQNPPGPKLALASPDGTYHAIHTFQFG